jgi:hypothetical protein
VAAREDPRPGRSGGERSGSPARKAFLLRLPPRMLADLKGWAAQDLRSLNAQIEYLLADALRRRKGGTKE